MNFRLHYFRHLLKPIVTMAIALSIPSTLIHALPAIPVYIKEPVSPNVLFTLDDSGSMSYAYAPDDMFSLLSTNRFLAGSYNPLAYNPNTVYQLPPMADGKLYTTTFRRAFFDGFRPNNLQNHENLISDLSKDYRPVHAIYITSGAFSPQYTTNTAASQAYYYVYDTTISSCPSNDIHNDKCYRQVIVAAAEEQNFANWFSFYRTRSLLLRSSVLIAMLDVDPNIRIAWQALNSCMGNWTNSTLTCKGGLGNLYPNSINAFNTIIKPSTDTNPQITQRTNFYNWVAELPANGGTPLPAAFLRAGEYFKNTGALSPYRNTPGSATSTQNACRQSYHVAFTDGIWNGVNSANTDADNQTHTLPDGHSYLPRPPYNSAFNNNIADLAFQHWQTDAQPNLVNTGSAFSFTGNSEPPSSWSNTDYWNPRNDPATWQHLVTYTVGLGLSKWLTTPTVWQGSTYASNANGKGYQEWATGTQAWPQTGPNQSANVYDLWHAAINSRGEFYSAETPQDVYKAFQSILSRIGARSGSVGTVSATSAYIFSDSQVYQSSFNSSRWSGSLYARKVNADGSISTIDDWNTDTTLDTQPWADRNLYARQSQTANNLNPTIFKLDWSNSAMNADTKAHFRSIEIVNWLRGDRSHENHQDCKSNCTLRSRQHVLGDIMGSSPALSYKEDFGYKNADWAVSSDAATSYHKYLTEKGKRVPAIVVGANDGFVHVFSAKAGKELFAYAPGVLNAELWRLSESAYVKKAFVDGPITIGDAYIKNHWSTYAVGTLGAGAKAVYALDITNPADMNAQSVKWEFTHKLLGHVISKPLIARLPSGTWVTIFSGGYENSSKPGLPHTATLFMLELETGKLLSELPITTSQNTLDGCGNQVSTDIANGLAEPKAFTTKDKRFLVYAGDLLGNMWRFQLDSTQEKLQISFNGKPFFKACNNGVAQAITAAPNVVSFGLEPYVYFGTGKFYDTGDALLTTLNSFYAVIDDDDSNANVQAPLNKSVLIQNKISSSNNWRVVDEYEPSSSVNLVKKRGWYLDLPASGERVLAKPIFFNEKALAFTSYIPALEGCESKGESWMMMMDAETGGRLPSYTFDVNNDGEINSDDSVPAPSGGNKVSPSGKAIAGTVSSIAALITSDNRTKKENMNGTSGCGLGQLQLLTSNVYKSGFSASCTPGRTFRTGWRQIR